jgi:hypothetical protein
MQPDPGGYLMRATTILASALLLGLGACSSLVGSGSKEQTQASYAGTSSMNAMQIDQLLRAQGYRDIANLHKNGTDWVGSAVNANGAAIDFDIDPGGTIHTK